MPIHYLSGALSPQKVLELNPDKPPVFIFPGNPGHHGKQHTLFSVKSGGGLAQVSREYGCPPYHGPTLSLPTTGMPKVGESGPIPSLAKQAVKDLWRTVGAGYDLVLPVRPQKLFLGTLSGKNGYEPSFWGGIETSTNPGLAAYYLEQINLLHNFLLQTVESQMSFFNHYPDLKEAYEEGAKNISTKNNIWYLTLEETYALNEFKKQVCESLYDYKSWYKLSLFGHHHNDRATQVIEAIMQGTREEVINILQSQKLLFENSPSKPTLSAESQKILGRFGKEIKNLPKADIGQKSGFYKAILTAIEIAESSPSTEMSNIPERK